MERDYDENRRTCGKNLVTVLSNHSFDEQNVLYMDKFFGFIGAKSRINSREKLHSFIRDNKNLCIFLSLIYSEFFNCDLKGLVNGFEEIYNKNNMIMDLQDGSFGISEMSKILNYYEILDEDVKIQLHALFNNLSIEMKKHTDKKKEEENRTYLEKILMNDDYRELEKCIDENFSFSDNELMKIMNYLIPEDARFQVNEHVLEKLMDNYCIRIKKIYGGNPECSTNREEAKKILSR